jgi:hypothetical protein
MLISTYFHINISTYGFKFFQRDTFEDGPGNTSKLDYMGN